MKCPHCLVEFHDNVSAADLLYQNALLTERVPNRPQQTRWRYSARICPACGQVIIVLLRLRHSIAGWNTDEIPVWPKGVARAPLPAEVVDPYASDYREACNVLTDSPKASAALSRRCLQLILRGVAKIKASDLSKEIDAVLPSLPSSIAEAVDAIRVIGNFAAHPIKSTNTGEIVDVEPGEAEWSLDVLESLFDYYFVQPAKLAAKKAGMNKKLADAGKPPMK
jgi:Domain of unknown function (DUF4145)